MNSNLLNVSDVKLITPSLEPIKLWSPTNFETNLTQFQLLIEQKHDLKFGMFIFTTNKFENYLNFCVFKIHIMIFIYGQFKIMLIFGKNFGTTQK